MMPVWIAVAIPALVSVGAALMWMADYIKKLKEIANLTHETIELKRREAERESRIYTPTSEEIAKYGVGIRFFGMHRLKADATSESLFSSSEGRSLILRFVIWLGILVSMALLVAHYLPR